MATLLIWEDTPGSPEAFRFDVVTSITHEGITEVTEHPVEQGVAVADHARPLNRRLSIEGMVSNTPMASNEDARIPGRISGVTIIPTPPSEVFDVESVELDIPQKPFKFGNPVGQGIDLLKSSLNGATGGIKATLFSATEFRDRVREMFEALEKARRNSYLIRVETALGDYDDMVIERVGVPRTAADGKSAKFQVELKEIRIVNAKSVAAPEPAEPLGFPLIARGSKNTKDDGKDSIKKEKLKQSFALQGASALSEAIGLGGL